MKKRRLLFSLAVADLWHERSMSACTVLAIAAVVAPLLLLFGLKFGTIETLRTRLIQDPKNRELTSEVAAGLSLEWFDEMRGREDVAFIVPRIRTLASTVVLQKKVGEDEEARIVRTTVQSSGPTDPFLIQYGVPVGPQDKQCVLNRPAAEQLGVAVGDVVTGTIRRRVRGKTQKGRFDLDVIGILDLEAEAKKPRLYADLELVESIEVYQDGGAVPWLDLPGDVRRAFPVYDGAVVGLVELPDEGDRLKIWNRTGFVDFEPIEAGRFTELTGRPAPEGLHFFFAGTGTSRAGENNVTRLRNRLRGRTGFLMPWVKPFDLRFEGADGQEQRLTARAHGLVHFGGDATSLGDGPEWSATATRLVAMHVGAAAAEDARKTMARVSLAGRSLEFPLEITAAPGGTSEILLPPAIAGRINLLNDRDLQYREGPDTFVLGRTKYTGFRMYARTIDDVDGLRQELQAKDYAVNSRASRILEVKRFDRILTVLFFIIALAAVAGAAFSLGANYIGSVERKRKELSVLRLIGFSGEKLLRFPVYQSVIAAALGFLLAFMVYWGFGLLLNHLADEWLREGERFCRLTNAHILMGVGATAGLALFSSLVAGRRAATVDPADGLRDE